MSAPRRAAPTLERCFDAAADASTALAKETRWSCGICAPRMAGSPCQVCFRAKSRPNMQTSHLEEYRNSPGERLRVGSLMGMLPLSLGTALDVGARDAIFPSCSRTGLRVTALDLEQPSIADARIECVKGNAAELAYPDNAFDVWLCAEVLEHIPPAILPAVCREIERVALASADRCPVSPGHPAMADHLASACGGRNPPWGHPTASMKPARHVSRMPGRKAGIHRDRPDGDQRVVGGADGLRRQSFRHLRPGRALHPLRRGHGPARASAKVAQRVATRLATWEIGRAMFHRPHANWIHILFEKRHA